MDETDDFNSKSKHIELYLYTSKALSDSFISDIKNDLDLISISMGLVVAYCIFFMGSFSPVHFRSVAACVTLLCIILSYCASVGILSYFGQKMSGIHSLLPFLLIGIGVDDMFVLSSCIDNTNPDLSVKDRM
jgi:Niemann-Pick C1 protein